jgi:hypothetical protein
VAPVRLTDEQQAWRTWLSGRVAAVNPRARVTTDAEGWPLAPGQTGQVAVTTDPAWLAVYTTRMRQVPKLMAVPGNATRWATSRRGCGFRPTRPTRMALFCDARARP